MLFKYFISILWLFISLFWCRKQISSVPPKYYAKRFVAFLLDHTILPPSVSPPVSPTSHTGGGGSNKKVPNLLKDKPRNNSMVKDSDKERDNKSGKDDNNKTDKDGKINSAGSVGTTLSVDSVDSGTASTPSIQPLPQGTI
jgi:hypothetical protein